MPSLSQRTAALVVATAVLSALPVAAPQARADDRSTASYIVTTTGGAATAATADKAEDLGGEVQHEYTRVLPGFAAELTAADVAALRADPRVESVVPDGRVWASANQVPAPWGLDRIDQRSRPLDRAYGYTETGAGVTVYVVDTGVRTTHREFGGRVGAGVRFFHEGDDVDEPGSSDSDTSDCFGHGTHVAGIIGGSTYGVAKGVTVVPVRVLDCGGGGWNSDVIAGLDWVVAQPTATPTVVNMSLSGPQSGVVDTAVARTVQAGIPVVVAAGNLDRDACDFSPARAPAAITVAASDTGDRRAYFSNDGPCVDLFAPGVGITSAWRSSDTATHTDDGTSMAAPFVSGIAARMLEKDPDLAPKQVSDQLAAAATTGKITDAGSRTPNRLAYVQGPPRRVPAAPGMVTVTVSNPTASGTVRWAAPTDWGTSPISTYKITRDGTDNRLAGPTTITVPASARSATQANLRGHRTYHQTVRAVTGVGAGPATSTDLTMGTVPLSVPTKVKVSKKSYARRTAKITWSIPTDTGGAKISGYRVYRSGKNTSGRGPYAKTLSARARGFTFTKLKRNKTYTLQVRAKTGQGYGPKATIKVKLER